MNNKTLIEFELDEERKLVRFEARRGRYWAKSSFPAEIIEPLLTHLDSCFAHAERMEVLKATAAGLGITVEQLQRDTAAAHFKNENVN